MTGSFAASFSGDGNSIPGALKKVTVVGRTNHPLKGNTDTSSTQSGDILRYAQPTPTSTTLIERFNDETKRVKDSVSVTYNTQAKVSNNTWSSTESLVGNGSGSNAGHNRGLMVFGGKLVGFTAGSNTNVNFGALVGPTTNPDYSSVPSATREYLRWFQNTEGAARQMFTITISGTGTIVSNSTTLTASNNLQVNFKIPHSNAAQETGFMDLAVSYSTGQFGDDAGCFDDGGGTLDSSLPATNTGTFGSRFVNNNEYILIRIKANSAWTGNISEMTLAWRTA